MGGWKYPIIQTSIRNTFFPIDFEDEGVLQWLYNRGTIKIFGVNGYPEDLKLLKRRCVQKNGTGVNIVIQIKW